MNAFINGAVASLDKVIDLMDEFPDLTSEELKERIIALRGIYKTVGAMREGSTGVEVDVVSESHNA